jgi:hypothetical protein
MRLVVAVDFRMQAGEAHQQRCPGAGMTKNKELLAREELFDLGNFLSRDRRDGIALFPFGIAPEQDAGGSFETGQHEWDDSVLFLPV